jgi:hypothetical protein
MSPQPPLCHTYHSKNVRHSRWGPRSPDYPVANRWRRLRNRPRPRTRVSNYLPIPSDTRSCGRTARAYWDGTATGALTPAAAPPPTCAVRRRTARRTVSPAYAPSPGDSPSRRSAAAIHRRRSASRTPRKGGFAAIAATAVVAARVPLADQPRDEVSVGRGARWEPPGGRRIRSGRRVAAAMSTLPIAAGRRRWRPTGRVRSWGGTCFISNSQS